LIHKKIKEKIKSEGGKGKGGRRGKRMEVTDEDIGGGNEGLGNLST
jgi:hypothetical protein